MQFNLCVREATYAILSRTQSGIKSVYDDFKNNVNQNKNNLKNIKALV